MGRLLVKHPKDRKTLEIIRKTLQAICIVVFVGVIIYSFLINPDIMWGGPNAGNGNICIALFIGSFLAYIIVGIVGTPSVKDKYGSSNYYSASNTHTTNEEKNTCSDCIYFRHTNEYIDGKHYNYMCTEHKDYFDDEARFWMDMGATCLSFKKHPF